MSDERLATDRSATFRDVFSSREFRAVFSSTTLSIFGDYLAKAAVTALVFQNTESVALSAAAFALSFVPWVVGGPFLATIAERYPYRRVMVICDLVQMVLVALLAIPNLDVKWLLPLLFLASLAAPPFQAARSALLPQLLAGDAYVVGLSAHQSARQVAQVAGYAVGAAMAPFQPGLALLFNAGTFAVSALIIRFGVGDRRPIGVAPESHLLRDTFDGFQVVFGSPVLRTIALLVFTSPLFAIVPEGLAAAWAANLTRDTADQGWFQGLIMIANPVGFVIGGLVVSRLFRPHTRQRLIRFFAVLAPLALVPALLNPNVIGIAAMAGVCGLAVGAMIPAANGLFVQALPAPYRARAFGVMQGGIQVVQGVAVLGTGLLADRFHLPTVVGWWSAAGVLIVLAAVAQWPGPRTVRRAIEEAQAINGTWPTEHTPEVPDTPPPRSPDTTTPTAGPRALTRGRGLIGMPGTTGPEHSEAGV